ncbi:MAG TPA: pyridoxamine 5'-phosphate oxidase family protein [Anaerolineae bacterium]|nr:pyridoxamine 5'-phosphate oxidase family protein [Anaerolineae bacterium]
MNDLRDRIHAFLAAHNTMTLATVDVDGVPQAAAVFYAADEALNLIFVSSPNSRHSVNLARQPLVAATIHSDNQAWQTIQGVQVEGTAHMVDGAAELVRAVQVYVRRFEFLRGLLDGAASGPAVLRGPVASSRFYVLRPVRIRLIDNSQGFGHKEELQL